MRARPVWIDTDPGVDDALAILLAVRSPELDVVGISTTHGNVSLAQATENACRVLEIAGLDTPPPVYRGARKPLRRKPHPSLSIHGVDGLGEIATQTTRAGELKYPPPRLRPKRGNGVDALVAAALQSRPKLTVITLGPLTNLALALRREPALAKRVRRVIAMIGAVGVPGNETPAAEFNAFCDPEAAAEVVDAGLPLTLIGLQVTLRATVSRAQLEAATRRSTPVNRFLRDCTRHVMRYYRRRDGFYGCCFHDPLTVASAIDPQLLTTQRVHVAVETAGRVTAGMTVGDLRGYERGLVQAPNVDVAMGVQPARFRRLLLRRVCDA